MKKTIVKWAVIGIICVVGIIVANWFVSHYDRYGIITNINYETGWVTFEDEQGNLWDFIGNGYEVSQKVKVRMNTNNTETIMIDDIIENVEIIEN